MRYIVEVLKKHRTLALFYVLLGVLCAFMTTFRARCFQTVIDGLTSHTASLGQILFYGALLVVTYLANYLDNYPERRLEQEIYFDFKLLALRKIGKMDFQSYQKLGTGELIQRLENGAEAGKNLLLDFWFRLIRELLPTALFSICFIWAIHRTIAYMVLGGYLLVFLVTNLLLRFLYQIKEKILTGEEQMNHYLVRGFLEMPVFRLARQFPAEIRKAEKAKEQIVGAKVKMTLIHEAFFTIFALLVAVLDIVILVYAWNTGSVSVGSVVALLSLLDNAYTPIAIFNVVYVDYKLNKSAFRRLEGFLSEKEDPQLETGKNFPICRGGIEIKGLSFSYEGRQIFHNLDLSVRPGEKVAFVGESGSGKTTLLKLLAGLVKYDSGSIAIDGNELKELCLDSLYQRLSYLSQDSAVFDGTLRENLVFDRPVPDEELLEALDQVRLTQLLAELEQGLDTRIGERGATLSGGERQRVALARLWLEQKDIAVLDEATSALDNLTEEIVMERSLARLKDRTVIVVAHRLSSIASFDRLVVFQNGEITAQGTFSELMENDPYFAELYRASIV